MIKTVNEKDGRTRLRIIVESVLGLKLMKRQSILVVGVLGF